MTIADRIINELIYEEVVVNKATLVDPEDTAFYCRLCQGYREDTHPHLNWCDFDAVEKFLIKNEAQIQNYANREAQLQTMLNSAQVAKHLGVTAQTLKKYRANGWLKGTPTRPATATRPAQDYKFSVSAVNHCKSMLDRR